VPDGLVLSLMIIGPAAVILLTIFWKKLFPPGKPPEDHP